MYEKLNEHITAALEDYDADKNSGSFVYTEEEKKLMKEYEECYSQLLQVLDDSQKKLFENYRFCLLKRESAVKAEYFTQGFLSGILGLNIRDTLFEE